VFTAAIPTQTRYLQAPLNQQETYRYGYNNPQRIDEIGTMNASLSRDS